MSVSASECLSYDIEIAQREGTPLRTLARELGPRVENIVGRMCLGCNLTCVLREEPGAPPEFVRDGDEEGLREACPLPSAVAPDVAS